MDFEKNRNLNHPVLQTFKSLTDNEKFTNITTEIQQNVMNDHIENLKKKINLLLLGMEKCQYSPEVFFKK